MDEPALSLSGPFEDSTSEFGTDEHAHEEVEDEHLEGLTRKHLSMDETHAYDLAPPPPRVSHANAERLAERLFSADHLNIIVKDPVLSHRFTSFLNRHKPQSVPTLVRYDLVTLLMRRVSWYNHITGI